MKYLFACDLDNTLIHSYKTRTYEDICIEIYNDKEQSFMSPYSIDLLREVVQRTLFIPITTRSIEQYNRISWAEGTKPEFAVVSNGAILLHDGTIDDKWRENVASSIAPHIGEINELYSSICNRDDLSNCRIVDDSFLFVACENIDKAKEFANEFQHKTTLTVSCSGRKVYFFPPNLNKGNAMRRLKQRFSPALTIAAGDSQIDIPMLELSDISYMPMDAEEKLFAEFFLADVLKIVPHTGEEQTLFDGFFFEYISELTPDAGNSDFILNGREDPLF